MFDATLEDLATGSAQHGVEMGRSRIGVVSETLAKGNCVSAVEVICAHNRMRCNKAVMLSS